MKKPEREPTDLDAIFLGSAAGAVAVLPWLNSSPGGPTLLDAEDFVAGSLLTGGLGDLIDETHQ